MPPLILPMDITVLPSDVLSLYDEPFYDLVKKLAGPIEAKLLEIQGIRSAYSLINTEDIFDILNNLRYLTQLLTVKNEEHLKMIATRLKSKNKSNDDSINDISQSQTTAQVLLISSQLEQTTTKTTTC
ncbi:unnamed protein product [Rotaria sp. Silwood2]|nr:unnamed protein product [Rotaria sp. Silwood2]CAF2974521.1 unnamed protein product [Rotaria sp. Silwood2]CAF3267895.1 unnamed protein product [Rotaria sp. Silwood2]CAF4214397.1 unnamed protein product [Rotaria sp. Silwood2]CAF4252984.1 unnamed protein product [Rotaria sp. Silwood2]